MGKYATIDTGIDIVGKIVMVKGGNIPPFEFFYKLLMSSVTILERYALNVLSGIAQSFPVWLQHKLSY